ncbi:Ig-like domain-containing protein, partial [Ostreibacterium oceani]
NTVISGDIELMWNTIDVDGDTLYQNPYLGDFLQPGAKGNNFVFDSTVVPSGPTQLGIWIDDGKLSTEAFIDVVVKNPLKVNYERPSGINVSTGYKNFMPEINVDFVTDLDPSIMDLTDAVTLVDIDNNSIALGDMTIDTENANNLIVPIYGPLRYNTTYTVILSDQLTDKYGNALTGGHSWQFTTMKDTTPATVINESPKANEKAVARNTLVEVFFSEALDIESVSDALISMKSLADNTAVSGAVIYDSYKQSIIFTPDALLDPETQYEITLLDGAKDTARNTVIGTPKSWKFTTTDLFEEVNNVKITDQYNDYLIDYDNDGNDDYLVIEISVEVFYSSYYNLNGSLYDSENTLIEWSGTGDIYLTKGNNTLKLYFDVTKIKNTAKSGQFYLKSLLLYSYYDPEQSDYRSEAWETSSYNVSTFHSPLTFKDLPAINIAADGNMHKVFNLNDYIISTEGTPSFQISYVSNNSFTAEIKSDGSVWVGANNVQNKSYVLRAANTLTAEIGIFVTLDTLDVDKSFKATATPYATTPNGEKIPSLGWIAILLLCLTMVMTVIPMRKNWQSH